jgi:hypothetical protein
MWNEPGSCQIVLGIKPPIGPRVTTFCNAVTMPGRTPKEWAEVPVAVAAAAGKPAGIHASSREAEDGDVLPGLQASVPIT